jgi:hypothetical protein
MELRLVSRCLAFLTGLLVATISLAQQGLKTPQTIGSDGHVLAPARAGAPNYGTTDLTYLRVPGIEFSPSNGGAAQGGGLGRYPITDNLLEAALHLPGGSIIDYLEIDFCDNLDPEDIHLYLVDCGPLGTTCSDVANVNSFGAPGCSAISTSGINHQVDNVGGSLALRAAFGALNTSNLILTSAIVGYRLQVSPAPVTATFNDVPTSDFAFQFIEAFNAAGITVGCNASPPMFCPDRNVTRREMAVFFAKALGLQFQ